MPPKLMLVYDIPKGKNSLLVRTWRQLNKLKAEKYMDSIWFLSDNETNRLQLKRIKNIIIEGGGKAELIIGDEVE